MLELLGQETTSSTSLSKSVLAVAPHLADDEDTVFEDPYLAETQKHKIAYASQKPFENLIIKAQGRRMREPIANSVWRLVILDKYVDFEKLYVTLDPGYNPNDEAKELSDHFTLLEKNTITSKRSVLTEAEWMRLYDVWVDAVLHFYPHRKASSPPIVISSSTCFVLLYHLSRPLNTTVTPVNAILDSRTALTLAKMSSPFLYFLNSYLTLLHRVVIKGKLGTILRVLRSDPKRYAAIGTWVLAKVTHVVSVVGTMSAASAMGLIEPKIKENVEQLSISNDNSREQQQLKAATHKAQDAQAEGTCWLKRNATEQLSEIPRYKRGFVWNKSSSSTSRLSPSALATETASPLAFPPSHLLNDPDIQATLHEMRNHIRVETPFNVDRFETMLYDHPNQPFVKSVMNSLRYGFWPFDEGDWKDDRDDSIQNYSSEELDLEAIRAFRDDEIQAHRWSDPISSNVLLPGMKLSPMFVIWQKGKARVVTDHTASGLNDYIPRSEA